MLVGLQGSGKTTTSGKLANLLRKQGKNPLLVACDVYRPAAIKQLQVVGKQLNIPVFANETSKDVVHIAKQAMSTAISKLNDVVILDTAGRLHIDEALMDELKNLKAGIKPHEILLVVDSMTGQDAVNVAEKFNEALGIDGVVLTKLDGDTRGGAALSVKKVTGKPIKFAATGEKLSDIEVFHPDRMAQRILGMGDILSVIEKAEESFDLEQAEKLEKQLRKKEFDLDDYLSQIRQIKKMGSFSSLLKMIPGMNQLKDVKIDDKEFVKIEAMICSMTKAEKRNTKLLNASRRQRIAKGSGTTVQDINKFIKSFEMTQKMMKKMQDGKGMKKMMKNFKGLDAGKYKLIETVTPSGYNTIQPIIFTIEATYDEESDDPQLTSLTGQTEGEIVFIRKTEEREDSLSTDVINKKGIQLPETGGMGRYLIYTLGTIFVLTALGYTVYKRNRKHTEK